MRVLVKIGGAALANPESRRVFAQSIATAATSGHELIVVHGGGPQMRTLSSRLNLKDTYHDGLRVTDAETAELAVMVLGGSVNRGLVAALSEAGVQAVGLTGADGELFHAKPYRPGGADLGYVGEIERVNPTVLHALRDVGIVPVIGTVGANESSDAPFLNINADQAVAPLAAAIAADAVLFLSDVAAVLDENNAPLPICDATRVDMLRTTNALHGGMLPKVSGAMAAATLCPNAKVRIASGASVDSIRMALAGGGTWIQPARASSKSPDAQTLPQGATSAGPILTPPGSARVLRTEESATHRAAAIQATPRDPREAHVLPTYLRKEGTITHGIGATLFTADNREVLDMLGGIAVSALGHSHPELVAALRDQAGRVLHVSNLCHHSLAQEVAAQLAELTNCDAVFFTNSGTEAVEAALKAARRFHHNAGHPERTEFVAIEGGFHGRTMGALSVTSNPSYRTPFEPLIPHTTFVPRDDMSQLRDALSPTQRPPPAALILEPIQGEAGIFELSSEFLHFARKLCTATGTLLIHDEIQSGCGRTGTFLAAQRFGIDADIVTLAKPLAAGLPMGAVAFTKQVAAHSLIPGDHGSTFAGGPLACRAALVFLQQYTQNLQTAVLDRGAQLRAGLDALAAKHPQQITAVRGIGLMQAIDLATPDAGKQLDQLLWSRGLLVNATSPQTVRFLPPYVITAAEIDRALDLLDAALRDLNQPLNQPSTPHALSKP